MIQFTKNETILSILDSIPKGKRYSDIEDAEGNQYVDLVQQGGGLLGIALVGYTFILEKAGIRFFSLAGTSAGAINTIMMAGLGKIQDAKSEQILNILSKKDLFEFVDGDKAIKKIINKIIKKEKGIKWIVAWNAIKICKILKRKLGLNPGNDFETWVTEELKKVNIESLSDLKELRKKLPEGLKNVDTGLGVPNAEAKLAIITSEITTHTKAEFPRMAELYWSNPNSVSPAKFVRASMSIPFFFEPFEVINLPNARNSEDENWEKYAGYKGEVPSKVKFVDGGMLSNFPINVFHREDGGKPTRPTFGVQLSTPRKNYSNTDNLLGMSGAMISTMRQIYDYDFLLKHPDYKKLICQIDADEQFNWLDFNMSMDDQVKLFNLGAQKALDFLIKFNWEAYKVIRTK
ncbi:MAG: patatin-like phospholipase family protein [Bacteroidetes bacterium]|nr:patatin-like phospholipase family protein [Bacteroidota bacterium]